MKADRLERGFVSISGIFALVVVVAGIFLAVKLIPPYVNNYQLSDAIQNLALNASYSQVSEEELQKTVISKAHEIGIDLLPKQVSVRKGAGTVVITARYSVPIDLLVRQVELHFEPSASNANILLK